MRRQWMYTSLIRTLLVAAVAVACTKPSTKKVTLDSVSLSPESFVVVKGLTQQLAFTGHYSDSTTKDLTSAATWSSADAHIASVSSTGLVTGAAAGATTITAAYSAEGKSFTGSAGVTVTNASLSSVTLIPPQRQIANKTQYQLRASAHFNDGTSADITAYATWSSSDESILTVGSDAQAGYVTAVAPGQATISAAWNAKSGNAQVTVTSATLVRVGVTPTHPSVAVGTQAQLRATGIFSDNTVQDLTAQAEWASSSDHVTVSNDWGARGTITGAGVGPATVSATVLNMTGSVDVVVTDARLASVSVSPPQLTLATGITARLHAVGTFTDGSTADLTMFSNWQSSNPSVATVAGSLFAGTVTAQATGSTTVTATYNGESGSTQITVTSASMVSLAVDPQDFSVAKGVLVQFHLTGTYSDDSTQDLTASAAWGSSDGSIVSIVDSGSAAGLATPLKEGSVTITAAFANQSVSTTLTVTPATLAALSLSPPLPSIALGSHQQFTVLGTYSDRTIVDLSASAVWSSSAPSVAPISNSDGSEGLAVSLTPGTTIISASFGSLSVSTTLTVTEATLVSIQITPAQPSIAAHTIIRLTATGTYTDGSVQDLTSQVAWQSSAPAIADILTMKGLVGVAYGYNAGSATITASTEGITGATSLAVTGSALRKIAIDPNPIVFARSEHIHLHATGIFSDETSQDISPLVTWASSSNKVTVSGSAWDGIAFAADTGSASITASYLGITGSAPALVTAATLASIEIGSPAPTMAKGTSYALHAIGHYSDNSIRDLTALAVWSSSDETTVTVSNGDGAAGTAYAAGEGSATVQAAYTGINGSLLLTVTPATLVSIGITPNPEDQETTSFAKGTYIELIATGVYTDQSTQDLTESVTWGSSTTRAVVSNAAGTRGWVYGALQGQAHITASYHGTSASIDVTVTPAVLRSIAVQPPTASLPVGISQAFVAVGTWTDGSSRVLTLDVTWDVSDDQIASVSNENDSHGVVVGLSVGSATVTASFEGVIGSASLSVTPAALQSLSIEAATTTLAKGTTEFLTAIGHFSDESTQDLTDLVTWTSSDNSIALVSNLAGSRGLVTAAGTGDATITAQFAGKTATLDMAFTAATLHSIAIIPSSPVVNLGFTVQLHALGTFSDSSQQDITANVLWKSTNEAVALVSNAKGSQGLVSAVSAGTTTISAEFGAVKEEVPLTAQ